MSTATVERRIPGQRAARYVTLPSSNLQVPVPAWVSAPDPEGGCDGPHWEGDESRLTVSAGWTPEEGAALWMDVVLYKGGIIDPQEARILGGGLLTAADLVEASR